MIYKIRQIGDALLDSPPPNLVFGLNSLKKQAYVIHVLAESGWLIYIWDRTDSDHERNPLILTTYF